uniref:Abscisic aldehyde oxidase 3 n=1 Tax=Tanacetum cinerariifolium TaxID=118510 RepID=A0A6L2NVH5_TANCI|nr:abscisic aldehyde oxidase 3 [Tanacetum cinerariifolium]
MASLYACEAVSMFCARGVEVRLTMEIVGVVPIPRHTRVSYVETILTMVMIIHHGYRLFMSRNRVTIKTLAANLSTHTPEPTRRFNSICYDDDDEEESTIPLNEIISQIPPSIAITPVLATMEPEDSLIMGDEDLRTIPAKESDEFIKSSVEDLVPIPRESEDTSDNDKECYFPFCDNFITFSNPLFDVINDFTSSNDESLLEEDIQEKNFIIHLNPLFDFDNKYISSDVNPLFNEVLEDIDTKDSYVSNLDEPALLVTHLSDANEDECFDPIGDIDKIDAFLDIDVFTNIEDGYHDLEGDIIYLESFRINDTIPNLPPKNFLPYLTYSMDSSLLLSSGSEDTIFDPGISIFSFYSLEPMAMTLLEKRTAIEEPCALKKAKGVNLIFELKVAQIVDVAAGNAIVGYNMEDLESFILTMEQAVGRSSFFEVPSILYPSQIGDFAK